MSEPFALSPSGHVMFGCVVALASLGYLLMRVESERAPTRDPQCGYKAVLIGAVLIGAWYLQIGFIELLTAPLTFHAFAVRLESAAPALIVGTVAFATPVLFGFPRTNVGQRTTARKYVAGVIALVDLCDAAITGEHMLAMLLRGTTWLEFAGVFARCATDLGIAAIWLTLLAKLSGLERASTR